ncbi:glutaredoxin-1 [Ambystoma mexicanum]|uniref:glutaredoxin-1 n=1 Tax=Ambystoma mexicanum TaxID=8296 RepID=UPI0037E71B13
MAQSFVDSKIQKGKVTVFLKPSCPYCVRAECLLKKFKIKPDHLVLVDISAHEAMNSIQDYLLQLTGERTVPRIFLGDKCVGGCSDVTALDNSGKLEPMIQAIGALQ